MTVSGTKRRKVAVVGAGAVGSTFCYALAQSGLADEIVLLDRNADLARGQALDLVHGQPFFPTVTIRLGEPGDYADAQLIVITAGVAQRRARDTAAAPAEECGRHPQHRAGNPGAENPGPSCWWRQPRGCHDLRGLSSSGWESGRIIGSGTVLDSARLRHILSRHCGIDPHNVHGYVLGEAWRQRGSAVAWSLTNIAACLWMLFARSAAGAPIGPPNAKIEQEVRKFGLPHHRYKGFTYYAGPGLRADYWRRATGPAQRAFRVGHAERRIRHPRRLPGRALHRGRGRRQEGD